MLETQNVEKIVKIIPPSLDGISAKKIYRQTKVAAYCRVSTKQEEQLNNYDVQRKYYEEKILLEPKWKLVGIYADKGITGTSMKKRDEFNKMIRKCKSGKIDMIITKSISRFARNTLDCIKTTRKLRELGVDVYFEEQNIHSIEPSSEFYISIYGSIAQSESENISANVKWGKAQSAKEGKVQFQYKRFLGYTKGEDGNPKIVEKEAEIIRQIYNRYLAGDSFQGIKKYLEGQSILSPTGSKTWHYTTIRSILTNEKYKGDAIINKTYIDNCINKKIKTNNGERTKYYVENNHPAIIDSNIYDKVQEEIARRNSKKKVIEDGKTDISKYSSKYALTELLICGECGTPYRRCTWTAGGKRVVWRCINRIKYGKRYCHNSPTLKEDDLQEAIMKSVIKMSKQNNKLLNTLKSHIQTALKREISDNNILDIQIKIAEIDTEFKKMISQVSEDNADNFDEEYLSKLMEEKQKLTKQLENIHKSNIKQKNEEIRFEQIYTILDGMKNHPIKYDDNLIRQILECVVVESKEKIKVVFKGGNIFIVSV